MVSLTASATDCETSVPNPIVKLNRWTLVTGALVALALGQPLITTALFVMVALAAVFGRRGSLIFAIGSRVLRTQNEHALAAGAFEDRRLMRFNNTLAAIMLGAAQLAFLAGWSIVGWGFTIAVAVAAGVALAGFCFGCLIYTQWHIRRTIRRRRQWFAG